MGWEYRKAASGTSSKLRGTVLVDKVWSNLGLVSVPSANQGSLSRWGVPSVRCAGLLVLGTVRAGPLSEKAASLFVGYLLSKWVFSSEFCCLCKGR